MGKLLYAPLAVMMMLTVMSIAGLGSAVVNVTDEYALYDAKTSTNSNGQLLYLYDNTGHAVCYWNGTAVDAEETGVGGLPPQILKNSYTNYANWRNSTGSYALFYDTEASEQVNWADIGTNFSIFTKASIDQKTFSFGDALGWIGIIGVIMGLGVVAGIKIFGSGDSDVSIGLLLKGTFFITIWLILTTFAYPLVLLGGYFVFLLYFALTFTYSVGVIMSTGSGES